MILKCLDRLFVHGIGFALEVSLRPFAGGHDGVLLLRTFFDISTGSHMNHSALLPGP